MGGRVGKGLGAERGHSGSIWTVLGRSVHIVAMLDMCGRVGGRVEEVERTDSVEEAEWKRQSGRGRVGYRERENSAQETRGTCFGRKRGHKNK